MLNVKNAKQYIEKFLKIKTKNNEIVPFTLNEPQKRLYDVIRQQAEQKKPIRLIILKARQMGFSTLTEALIFHRTATKANVNSLIIAHKDDATNYDCRIPVEGGAFLAWGHLTYTRPLTEKEASDYELRPAPVISELSRKSEGRPLSIARQMKEAGALAEASRGDPVHKKKAPDRGDR